MPKPRKNRPDAETPPEQAPPPASRGPSADDFLAAFSARHEAAPAAAAHVDPAAMAAAAAEAAAAVPEQADAAPPGRVAKSGGIAASPASGPAQAVRGGWRERLAGSGFAKGLSGLFSRHPVLDDELLDELETCLITADMGFATASELIEDLRRRTHRREFADVPALLATLRGELLQRLQVVEQPLDIGTATPFVVLTVGVNGVGKTTTIGKLAHRWGGDGRKVLLAAGDTFRAAAVEQLQAWGERNGVPVIAQGQGADAASVIFDALQTARARGTDVLIADTAGRLHTQSGLMDELAKIRRVLGKLDPDAPHEVLLVIDGTTGQNAINQVRQFQQAIGVTGLIVTKLDGTAKGGVVFALAREFGLPIRFVGLGEGIGDLRVFDAAAFVDALLPASLGSDG